MAEWQPGRELREDPQGLDEDDDVAADRDICSAMFNGILGDVIADDFIDRFGSIDATSGARFSGAKGEEMGKVIVSGNFFEKLKNAKPDAEVPKEFLCEFSECHDPEIAFRTDTEEQLGFLCSAQLCPVRAAQQPPAPPNE